MAKEMSPRDAIKIIQVAERARQGRMRAKMNEENRKKYWMYRPKEPDPASIELAALCIQKVLLLSCIMLHASFCASVLGNKAKDTGRERCPFFLFISKRPFHAYFAGVEGLHTKEEGKGRPGRRNDFSWNGV